MKATAEYERKLDAPVGFRLPPLGGQPLESRSFRSVYYDVPGGSLAASGITLRRRTERGRSVWQLKLPAKGSRLELEEPGGPVHVPENLTLLLRAHLRRGPLATVVELRTRRSGELVVRDGSQAEVTLDEVSVMDTHRVRDRFVEVEVELRNGDPRQLDRIARELRDAGAKRGAETPKLFRVLAPAERPRQDGPAALEALRAGLLGQLREIEAHDPGTRLDRDPESLHDMRVAVRRARALFRAGRPVIGGDTAAVETGLKELGRVLGDVRDLDVLIERLRAEAEELEDDDRAGLLRCDFLAYGRAFGGSSAAAARARLRPVPPPARRPRTHCTGAHAERRRLDAAGSRRSPGRASSARSRNRSRRIRATTSFMRYERRASGCGMWPSSPATRRS